MTDELSGIAIIICIAFGILTFLLLFIFANRQIKRFSLRSKYCPHVPIAHDVPKSLQVEIHRRLDIVQTISSYQPKLLKESDDVFFDDDECAFCMPVHLYRMKALDSLPILDSSIMAADPAKVRSFNQDYKVYILRLAQSGFLGKIEISSIYQFLDLYEFARHEPGVFTKEHYDQFIGLMAEIQQSISDNFNSSHPQSNGRCPSVGTTSSKHRSNGKYPAIPSYLQAEPPLNEDKMSYETSV